MLFHREEGDAAVDHHAEPKQDGDDHRVSGVPVSYREPQGNAEQRERQHETTESQPDSPSPHALILP